MKRGVYIGILVFVTLLSVSFASAYVGSGSFRYAVENIIQAWVDILEPILQALLGGTVWTGYLLFEKLLIFILLVGMVQLALLNAPVFKEQKAIRWIVSIIVPLIGVRYLDYDWIHTIINQYQVLAIVLTAILPFVIYFFFLYAIAEDRASVRKIGWIFFIVVYFGLWATETVSAHEEIYLWTMLIALVFLFFDGTIHKYYLHQRMKEADAHTVGMYIAQLRNQIQDVQRAGLPPAQEKKLTDPLYKKIRDAQKHL
ncbi:hypothetical protein KW787_02465 [Candidatus Pacearchaeota archaeon]|nr:hypothetical protein [Candidatus Pacearchaeota archaeon]